MAKNTRKLNICIGLLLCYPKYTQQIVTLFMNMDINISDTHFIPRLLFSNLRLRRDHYTPHLKYVASGEPVRSLGGDDLLMILNAFRTVADSANEATNTAKPLHPLFAP